MNRADQIAQDIAAAITIAPKVRTTDGAGTRKRLIADVLNDISIGDLWLAHLAGVVQLSRCDLPQAYDGGFKFEEATVGGFSFHFIEWVR